VYYILFLTYHPSRTGHRQKSIQQIFLKLNVNVKHTLHYAMHTVMEGGMVSNLLWSIKFWLFMTYFCNFLVPFSFSYDISLSFRFRFPAFRFEAKQAKKWIFFASKRNKFCLIFASFRFNRKRMAHPTSTVLLRQIISVSHFVLPQKELNKFGKIKQTLIRCILSTNLVWGKGLWHFRPSSIQIAVLDASCTPEIESKSSVNVYSNKKNTIAPQADKTSICDTSSLINGRF
jgi:hypothetical protein